MKTLIFTSSNQIQQSAAALATACHAARRGQRVLIASSGPGHLLGALVGQSLGARPLELEPNLSALEVSPVDEIGQRWDSVRPTLRSGIAARLRDIGPDELPSFPGMDAVSAMLVAERARASGRFDLLVLDGPSPAGLFRALTLPDSARWLVRLIFGLDRGPGRSRSSQENALIPAALIAPSMTAPLQDLRLLLEEQRATLTYASGTRVRVVVTPEELSLPPLRTALVGLGLYGMAVDELIVNGDPAQVDAAARHTFSLEASPSRPPLQIARFELGPADRDSWALRGAALYRDRDVFNASEPARQPSTDRDVRLYIPFLEPKGLDIAMASEEVVLRLGQFRRHLLLVGLNEGGRLRARVENEILRVWVE